MKRLSFLLCLSGLAASVGAADLLLTTDRPERLYPLSSNAVVTVSVRDGNVPVRTGRVKVRVSNDGGREVFGTSEYDLAAGNPFTVDVKVPRPGFALVEAKLAGGSAKAEAVLGFDVERVQASRPEPDDFDAWWKGQFAAQAALADAVLLEPLTDAKLDARFDHFLVRVKTIADEGCVYGFLSVPKKMPKGKTGCIVIVQCAGAGYVEPEENIVRADMMTLTMNVHPWNPTQKDYLELYRRERAASPHGAYMYRGCESRERCYFRNAVLGCKTAVDAVLARPDFDGELFYLGTSQGGGFGLILGGIFGVRFRALCIGVPAMCDLYAGDTGRHDGWPCFGARTKSRDLSYFDGVHWAKRIKSPVHFTIGLMDRTCPASGTMAAYNAIPRTTPKFLMIGPHWGHGTSWSTLYNGFSFLQNFMDPDGRPSYERYYTVPER